MSRGIRGTLRSGAAALVLVVVALLTPQECKDQCKACICQWDGQEFVCVCLAPR